MAVIVPTRNPDVLGDGGSVQSWTWTPMLNGDTGTPIGVLQHADRSIQVSGTFGAGGSATVQGSNNGSVSFVALNSVVPAAVIAITADAIKQIVELPLLIRPAVTAGDGTTSLTAVLVVRRQQPMRV